MRTVFNAEMRKDCGVEGQGGSSGWKDQSPECLHLALNAVVRCSDVFSWCKV